MAADRPLRVISCACCLRPKWRETDPRGCPGHYSRVTFNGWCACVEDSVGRTIRVGPERMTRGAK